METKAEVPDMSVREWKDQGQTQYWTLADVPVSSGAATTEPKAIAQKAGM